MLVPHPEFRDILVNIETHKYVVSIDNINLYGYYGENEGWIKFNNDFKPLTKEEYVSYYCKYEDGKIIYKA